MSALAARTHPRGALRTFGMLLALALGGVAVYLVVVGHTQKQVQIGLLVGLWGLLLGAFSLFGPRRGDADEPEVAVTQNERAVVRRGEQDQQLAVMVRRETERVLRDELSQLRNEVAGLRNDLVEKVNGQLRLERIETTRVISSDIEELQHEVRRLAVASRSAQQAINSPGFASGTVVETEVRTSSPLPYVLAGSAVAPPLPSSSPAVPAQVVGSPSAPPAPHPVPGMVPQRPAAPVQARPVPPAMPPAAAPQRALSPQVPPPVPRPVRPPAPPASVPPPVPRPVAPPRAPAPPPTPAVASFPPPEHATSVLPRQQVPPQQRPVSQQPAVGRLAEPADPLQALPRLTRFEYDWEAPPERPSPAWDVTHPEPQLPPSSSPAPESYTGRRRSPGEVPPPPPDGTNGHNGMPRGNGSGNGAAAPSGRRRHRGDGAGDDVLGRLLGR